MLSNVTINELKSIIENVYPKIYRQVTEPRFNISAAGVTNRWITHWDEKGLLPGEYNFGAKRRFDLIGYVWLQIIKKLRAFGLPLSSIKKVKEVLFPSISPLELYKTNETFRQIWLMQAEQDGKTEKELLELLSDPSFIENLESVELNLLEGLVLQVLIEKVHTSLMITEEGEVGVWSNSPLARGTQSLDEIYSYFMSKSFVSISISEILADFILEKDIELTAGKMRILSNQESEILSILRDKPKSVKKIELIYNDSKIERTNITRTVEVKSEKDLLHLIMKHGYQSIKLHTEKGKVVSCEETIKKKLL